MDGLVKALIAESAGLLKGDAARTGEKITRFFSRLRPVVTYNPLDNTWTGSISADIGMASDQTPLFIEAPGWQGATTENIGNI